MAGLIVCCGEALVDMLPRKTATGEDAFLPVAGGAIFNTAITLGRLGAPSAFLSGISTDMFGEMLIETLQASKVETGCCLRSKRPTTLAFVKLTDGKAEYSFMDENSAGRMITVADLPALPKTIEAMHFGAISLIPDPCGTTYETLMEQHCEGAVVSLDPNIRPGFINDPETYRARIDRMIAMADIVKISDEDLDWMAEGRDHRSVIDTMLAKGVAVVLLTKGGSGTDAFTSAGQISVPARNVEVVDTIGAGDSFNGGFLEGLRRTGMLSKAALKNATPNKLEPAVRLAINVAAVTVSRAGANPPWADELDSD